MRQQFIKVKIKIRGTELTVRRWLDPYKEEYLIDDNFARLNGFQSKQEYIAAMLDGVEGIDYQEGNELWVEFDEEARKITSVSVSRFTTSDLGKFHALNQ